MKFENLEEMSKCPGLIFAVNVLGLTNKQKICQNLKKKKKKKKLSFGFQQICGNLKEKKIEKLKKLSFGCHFGRKRRGKAGEISVKFENLEKKNEQMD